jgi:hypothetical protein
MADVPQTDYHSIQGFIDKFNGGTRVNRFKVTGPIKSKIQISTGTGTGTGTTTTATTVSNSTTDFHIRSASIPGSYINPVSMNWRGRTINFPGDRSYEPWQIVVVDDTGKGNVLYNGFLTWHKEINDAALNKSSDGAVIPSPKNSFSPSDWIVKQLEPNGVNYVKQFKLKNCWPLAIGALQLDMSQDNTIAAFAVTMRYSHYETDFVPAAV